MKFRLCRWILDIYGQQLLSCLLFEVWDSVPLHFRPIQIFAANANYVTSDMPLSVFLSAGEM